MKKLHLNLLGFGIIAASVLFACQKDEETSTTTTTTTTTSTSTTAAVVDTATAGTTDAGTTTPPDSTGTTGTMPPPPDGTTTDGSTSTTTSTTMPPPTTSTGGTSGTTTDATTTSGSTTDATSTSTTSTTTDGSTSTTSGSTTSTTSTTSSLPDVFKKFNSNLEIYVDGTNIVIKSDGIPDHNSPYFDESDSRYEANTDLGFAKNPGSIEETNHVYTIPMSPAEATNKATTGMGPIGVSLNGVPFFNQYAAGGATLTDEIFSFDQYNGHPASTQYHYHIEPTYLTAKNGKDALLGFLLDGFPIYGPEENGIAVTNTDLDDYHGHSHATSDYPNGIYHYHITDADPYLNGNGYFGTAGTHTN